MAKIFTYDLFISHSSKDKDAVRELAKRLKADGLNVWFDEWHIRPGDLISLQIEKGLEQSRTLVLAMSANAMRSDWTTLERHTVLFRDPINAQRRFIPVRLDDSPVPDTLKQFAYIDWRTKSEDQYARLLIACKTRPPVAPPARRGETVFSKRLKGSGELLGVAVTPNGKVAISGSWHGKVRIWNVEQQKCIETLEAHADTVPGVAVTDDCKLLVSGSHDHTIALWRSIGGRFVKDCVLEGHTDKVIGVAVTPDGSTAISASWDRTLRVWDLTLRKCLCILSGHTGYVIRVALTADGKRAISGSSDKSVRFWNLESGTCIGALNGHTHTVIGVAISPDCRIAVSGSEDNTLRVWDLQALKCIATLEGHTGSIAGVAITLDGLRAISASWDRTIKIWEINSGRCIATLDGNTSPLRGVAVTPDARRAVSVAVDNTISVWQLPSDLEDSSKEPGITRYTNAKVLLVGESGVGKTGLAIRLTQDRFEPTFSTDGAWATQMKLPHENAVEEMDREIWLWDFAGQADYRLIHQLFMDETSLAVLVFNPQSEDPFEGLAHWDRDLTKAARRPFRKLLIAGRCDRGGPMVSERALERFRAERGFAQYLETSALTGSGCKDLRDAVIRNIEWSDIPWTASPRIFKLLKEAILNLKDEGKVLLRVNELKQQLEMRLPKEHFTVDQLRAVIALLAGPGVVWQLEFGDFILLQPERINAYAAAVIRAVRSRNDEIGCISEERVLAGQIDYQDMCRLSADEEQIVLRAMHQIFIEHGLCLREPTDTGPLLVFPSYFKRERPGLEDHPLPFVSYHFNGPLEEIYATLIVRLHHTPAFEHDQLWHFAADFKTHEGKRVGLKLLKRSESPGEITVYFDPSIPDDTKVTFIRYVHDHLRSKDPNASRIRHYVCSFCETPVENYKTVQERLKRGFPDIVCVSCEKRVPIFDLIEQKFASEELKLRVQEMEEVARIKMDNENLKLILLGHALAVAGETGQIFRQLSRSEWGIDGEIEFKNQDPTVSNRVYLHLNSGDAYFIRRKFEVAEYLEIKDRNQAEFWEKQTSPIMLVMRSPDGAIRWMDIGKFLREERRRTGHLTQLIEFKGELFTALSLLRLQDQVIPKTR